MTELGRLLEQKRLELRETPLVFAGRLFGVTPTASTQTFYYGIKAGSRALPKKHLASAVRILGLSLVEVEQLNKRVISSKIKFDDLTFTGNELRRLAGAADMLGKALSLTTILQILKDLRKSPSP